MKDIINKREGYLPNSAAYGPSWITDIYSPCQEIRTRKFLIVFTKPVIGPHHEPAESSSTSSNPTNPRSTLSYHLCLCLTSVIFPSGFHTKFCMNFSSPHCCYMPVCLVLIRTLILSKMYKLWRSSYKSVSRLVTFSFLEVIWKLWFKIQNEIT
jgi:hypothetical protein